MIDIDKYLNVTTEIRILGKNVNVKQPSAKLTKEISIIEEDINQNNFLELKSKIVAMLLNNNTDGYKFTVEDLDEIPYKLQDLIIKEITSMVVKADNDPN